MPRKNRPKKGQHFHEPTVFDENFKPGCYGCAFAGYEFKCKVSDGKCLKSNRPHDFKRKAGVHAES